MLSILEIVGLILATCAVCGTLGGFTILVWRTGLLVAEFRIMGQAFSVMVTKLDEHISQGHDRWLDHMKDEHINH